MTWPWSKILPKQKYVIQKETGLGETTVVELDSLKEAPAAYAALDARLWQTNAKIVEAREFIQTIKDPNYRYLFTGFLDELMGISSQAESIAKKAKVEAPPNFDEWMAKRQSHVQEVPKK